MSNEPDLLAQARHVTPLAARQYALAKGWLPLPNGTRSRVYLFKHPVDQLRQLIIPMDHDYEDYPVAILDVAERLSQVEARPIVPVLSDLLAPASDVLRFRLLSPRAETGSISLQGALSLLEGAKQALLSAAHSVEHPQRHHPRLNRLEGKDLLKACRFGQTERGSFVLKIVCPLEAVDIPPSPDTFDQERSEIPFVRRTTNWMMASLAQVASAVEQGSSNLPSAIGEPPLLSSNFCDSLLTMLSAEEDASVQITVDWAAVLPQSPTAGIPSSTQLQPDYFPLISRIRQSLFPSDEDREALFVGTVEELRGEPGADGRRSGEVILSLLHEGERIPARVSLTTDQYAIATQAHSSPGGFVKLHGILQRGKRINRVVNLQDFTPVR